MDVVTILRNQGVATEDAISSVERLVSQQGKSYEEAMIQAGIKPEVIRTVFSTFYGVPTVIMDSQTVLSQDVLAYVSEESARYYRIIPFRVVDGVLHVATNDPDNLQIREVLDFVSTKNNIPYKLVFMLAQDMEKALSFYESLTGEVGHALGTLESELEADISEKEKEAKKLGNKSDAEILKEDAPVTKIVATILRYAVDGGASDIHIEPTDKKVVVRFRVDGELQKSLELPVNVKNAVVARVKILASARLDERRKPQDGRFSATFDGRKIDFRVSILPTSHGEKVVMRILDNVRGVHTLEDTGMSDFHMEIVKKALKEPFGIILISGPTGSGKSTTLYGMMDYIDKEKKNVMSLEDPVEYNIENVSQSQMRPEIGYTFAAGLRSALRQDPDIIMVGEIRDKETAQLAIQAALTGHLVLSTIHTNNSIGVIPRLIDMGVDPYLIAPTLKLAIAQRLARKLCPNSGEPLAVEGGLKSMIDEIFSDLPEKYRQRIPKYETMMHPVPSPGCSAGTKGRSAVMETFPVTEEIRELILSGGSEEDMYKIARKRGFMSMQEDAIIKALKHEIPYEEMTIFGTKVGRDLDFEEGEGSPDSPVTAPETTKTATQPAREKEILAVDNL